MSDTPRPPAGYARSGEHRIAGPGEVVGGLAVLDDVEGSTAMGLLAADVVYVCFIDRISESLGRWCARRLGRLLERGPCLVFLDAHAAMGPNVVVASAVMKTLLEHANGLSGVVCLTVTSGVVTTANALRGSLGSKAIVTHDPSDFDCLLSDAAPEAHATVRLANCRRVTPSVRPRLRVVRSA